MVEVVIIQGGVVVGRRDHRGREGEGSVAVEEEGSRQLPILHAHAELCGAPGSGVMSGGRHADVGPEEAAMGIADGNREQRVHVLAMHVVALRVWHISIRRGLHLEVHPIDGAHLTAPEATTRGCCEVCLNLAQPVDVVDGEVYVVQARVDGVDCAPDAREDTGPADPIDEMRSSTSPPAKYLSAMAKRVWS